MTGATLPRVKIEMRDLEGGVLHTVDGGGVGVRRERWAAVSYSDTPMTQIGSVMDILA